MTIINATEYVYTDYDEFQKRTGLIDNDKKLSEIGATSFIGESENGGFPPACIAELVEFCRRNPKYHIATLTCDSDDTEWMELEKRAKANGLDLENMTDDEQETFREREGVFALTINNKIRIVNRMDYYLADGDADGNLFLEEITN